MSESTRSGVIANARASRHTREYVDAAIRPPRSLPKTRPALTSGPGGHSVRLALGTLAITLAVGAAVGASDAGSPHGPTQLWTGLALAGIAGTAAAGIAVISHRLGALAVGPVTVTAHRFHLTYLLAFALLALNPRSDLGSVNGGRIAILALPAIAGIAARLFVLQIGMQHTALVVVAVLASAVPGLTYLAAVSATRQSFDPIAFALVPPTNSPDLTTCRMRPSEAGKSPQDVEPSRQKASIRPSSARLANALVQRASPESSPVQVTGVAGAGLLRLVGTPDRPGHASVGWFGRPLVLAGGDGVRPAGGRASGDRS